MSQARGPEGASGRFRDSVQQIAAISTLTRLAMHSVGLSDAATCSAASDALADQCALRESHIRYHALKDDGLKRLADCAGRRGFVLRGALSRHPRCASRFSLAALAASAHTLEWATGEQTGGVEPDWQYGVDWEGSRPLQKCSYAVARRPARRHERTRARYAQLWIRVVDITVRGGAFSPPYHVVGIRDVQISECVMRPLLRTLSSLYGLRQLGLTQCNVNSAVVQVLTQHLPHFTSLRELDLCSNPPTRLVTKVCKRYSALVATQSDCSNRGNALERCFVTMHGLSADGIRLLGSRVELEGRGEID